MKKHICIDFEGEGRKRDGLLPHPSLLGAWIPDLTGRGGTYRLWLFERELAPLTRATHITGRREHRRVCSLEESLRDLIGLASNRNCRLVAFSEHEAKIIDEHLDSENRCKKAFHERFYNIRPKAKSLANKRRLETGENSLTDLLGALAPRRRSPPPPSCGVAEACRQLRKAGSVSRRWHQWNGRHKQMAIDLIAYNRGDCVAVLRLINKVSAHYEIPGLS